MKVVVTGAGIVSFPVNGAFQNERFGLVFWAVRFWRKRAGGRLPRESCGRSSL
jgi:hypothetical protein